MKRRLLYLILLNLLCWNQLALAYSNEVTVDLQNANLSDTIRLLARFLHINVVISSSVHGVVTLHLQDAAPDQAFNSLLSSQGLASWQTGKIWFVAPRSELIKRKQEEIKWQEVWDAALPLFTQIWQIKYAKAQDIARIVKDEHASFISKRGYIRVDTRTNAICLQDTREKVDQVRELVTRLDVPIKQILIEARVVGIDSAFERELGIDFSVSTNSGLSTQAGRYSLAVVTLADSSILDVKLSALENEGHAELISSPSLFTSNQQAASIEAGEEVPYQEVSESGGTAVVFKKAVLALRVTPQVLPGNLVQLQLQINQDRPSSRMVLGMPTIRTRQIITSVLLNSGQTVVLGGIYETSDENAEQRIPFLGRLPVLGYLFTQSELRRSKRELLIFVTPKVIDIHESSAK